MSQPPNYGYRRTEHPERFCWHIKPNGRLCSSPPFETPPGQKLPRCRAHSEISRSKSGHPLIFTGPTDQTERT